MWQLVTLVLTSELNNLVRLPLICYSWWHWVLFERPIFIFYYAYFEVKKMYKTRYLRSFPQVSTIFKFASKIALHLQTIMTQPNIAILSHNIKIQIKRYWNYLTMFSHLQYYSLLANQALKKCHARYITFFDTLP